MSPPSIRPQMSVVRHLGARSRINHSAVPSRHSIATTRTWIGTWVWTWVWSWIRSWNRRRWAIRRAMHLVKYIDKFMIIIIGDIPQHDPSEGLLLDIVDLDSE